MFAPKDSDMEPTQKTAKNTIDDNGFMGTQQVS